MGRCGWEWQANVGILGCPISGWQYWLLEHETSRLWWEGSHRFWRKEWFWLMYVALTSVPFIIKKWKEDDTCLNLPKTGFFRRLSNQATRKVLTNSHLEYSQSHIEESEVNQKMVLYSESWLFRLWTRGYHRSAGRHYLRCYAVGLILSSRSWKACSGRGNMNVEKCP